MLADKTLLSVTLATTFVSGAFVGFAAKGAGAAGVPPRDAAAIYAPQLAELAGRGYDENEMSEARVAYTAYLKDYEYWWNSFLDTHHASLDGVDKNLTDRLAALAARHAARSGAK